MQVPRAAGEWAQESLVGVNWELNDGPVGG